MFSFCELVDLLCEHLSMVVSIVQYTIHIISVEFRYVLIHRYAFLENSFKKI